MTRSRGPRPRDGNLRPNFIRACTEANTDGAEIELTADQIAAYCECAFVEIVEYFGGEIDGSNRSPMQLLPQIRDVTSRLQGTRVDLRDNPEDIPADIRALLTGQGGCTDQALAS